MEKVVEISRVVLPDGEEFDLEYFLVTQEPKERVRAYGIGIQKLGRKSTAESGTVLPEREVVEKLTESEEKAMDWIARLARNQVTPISLVEVLDELVTKEGI